MSRLKITAIIITFFVLSSFNVTSIFAFDCPNTRQFLFDAKDHKTYVTRTAIPRIFKYFTRVDQEEKIDLIIGESVCSYDKFDEGFDHTENGELGYSATYKTCIGENEYSITDCNDSQICLYDSKNKEATCESIKGKDGCDTPKNGIDTNIVTWPKFTIEGDEVCINNVRNKCNLYSGNWEPIEDCGKLPCNMFGTQPMKTKCVYTCDNPKASRNDKICSQDGTSVLICEESGWKQKHLAEIWPDQKCEKCLYDKTDGTIECVGDGQLTCSKIEGDSSKPDEKRPGQKVCNSEKNYLYVCDVNDKNFNGEYFKPEENCLENTTDGRTCCGIKTGASEYGCITQKECDDNPQNLLDINVTPVDKFWCGSDHTKINTAIGCLPITIGGLVDALLPTIFGIAGGIAFLMMVYGFVMISTSSGDEKKMQAAKQIVTSAITGLLVAIFALFIYRLIAVDILHIPGI